MFNLAKKAIEYLRQNPGQKFTSLEIAEWIYQNYPDECRAKQDRSNVLNDRPSLLRQIAGEIQPDRLKLQDNPDIKTTEGRPRKFYFTESTDKAEIDQAESHEARPTSKSNGSMLREHDLYPILSNYLYSEFGIYSKRIDDKYSKNSQGPNGNKWLYPDLVGMENLSHDWCQEIKDCVQQYADKKTKLWSFEVKIEIKRSNLRKFFFQAVSNSSWANFGYLVANDIEGPDTLKELRMLAGLHGIGFILLDRNPGESQIMIPARERNEIDWKTANRITKENNDFLEYIKLIRQFYQTGEMRKSDWDMNVAEF